MDLLKKARLERHWTQVSLADAVGVTSEYYRQIEAGRARPSADLLERLLDVLYLENPSDLGYSLVEREAIVVINE